MMEYFSEIYGNYYRAVAAVLAQASVAPLTEREISDIVSKTAFDESALYITPNLISGKWPLLQEKDGLYYPVTRHDVKKPMTTLQKRWLRTMLEDPRCCAFFDSSECCELKAALNCDPLYDQNQLISVDICADGDPFSDAGYRQRLRTIIDAIRSGSLLQITYVGGKGSRTTADFLPCRLEYSPKDDKLRLLAVRIRYGKAILTATLNLARIEQIEPSKEQFEQSVDYDELENHCRRQSHQNEPVVIELTDFRNALERFMVQFASYDKRTRRIDDTNKYICSIYYNFSDETELLIRLLSFGVTIKVLSPERMVSQMRERIDRQWKMLQQPISPVETD